MLVACDGCFIIMFCCKHELEAEKRRAQSVGIWREHFFAYTVDSSYTEVNWGSSTVDPLDVHCLNLKAS